MVSLMASYTVKPALQTPTEPMYISEFDQYNSLSHAPTVYFYRPPPSDDPSIFSPTAKAIEILKDSLSKVLVLFYPLAGRLQWTNNGSRLELDCNSMGALLLEAESNAKIDDFGDFCPTPETRSLLPSVDNEKPIHELPLLLVQFTKFSCGGVCIGLGISHVLVDGVSAGHFVSEWARIARGDQPEHFPFLDRTVLRTLDGSTLRFDHPEFSPRPLIIGHTSDLEERKKETTVTMLKLTREQIQKLRNKANEGNSTTGGHRAFTKFEAVASHIWRCATKARKHRSEQLTTMFCAVNFRDLLDPPLPKWYFGNAVLVVTAMATSGELLEKPLVYATRKVREAIRTVTNDYVRSALDFLRNEPDLSKFRYFHVVGSTMGAFKGNPNISVTSWTSLPLYNNADFGWGKEIHFGPAVLGYDGKAFVLPGRDEEGSFVIPLRLQVEHMDAFKKLFYEDI